MLHNKLIIAITTAIIAAHATAAEPDYRGGVASPYATPQVQNGPEARNSAINVEHDSAPGPIVRNSRVNALDALAPTGAGPTARNSKANAQEPEHVAATGQKSEQTN